MNCLKCPIDKMCNKYYDCVYKVYAAGLREGKKPTHNKSSAPFPKSEGISILKKTGVCPVCGELSQA